MQAAVQESHAVDAVIHALVLRHKQAWNNHDAAAYGSLFTEDADFVNVVGQHVRSRRAVIDDFAQIHRTFMRNSVLAIESVKVDQVDEHTAIAHIHWSMTGVEKVPGWNVPDVRHGVAFYVAVEQGGEWKVRAFQNTEVIPFAPPK